jgi:hypothetical protein
VFLRDPTRGGCINVINIMVMKKLVIGLASLFFASSVFAGLPRDTSGEAYHKEWLWSAIEKAKAEVKDQQQSNVAYFPPTGPQVDFFPPTGPQVDFFPPTGPHVDFFPPTGRG